MTGPVGPEPEGLSPAQRYARARRGPATPDPGRLAAFAAGYPFAFDEFQWVACEAIDAGRGVLVAAPTGSGKTLVGEYAVHVALATGRKAFYTTPIKALSNQKYADLARRHGADKVGLLTGDVSRNGEAPVVVMTTEVLRNMLYANSTTLTGLGCVVVDEVHYLADRMRGAVWEEVIIHLPPSVQVVSLSATVSNAEEFGDWLSTVRGATDVVVEEHRPVPLWQHMLVGNRLEDLFVDPDSTVVGRTGGPGRSGQAPRTRKDGARVKGRPRSRDLSLPERRTEAEVHDGSRWINPALMAAIDDWRRTTQRHGRRYDVGAPSGRRGRPRRGPGDATGETAPAGPGRRLGRAEVVTRLDREGLLPAITFIFSRAGCDGAVAQLLGSGIRLVPYETGEQIRDLATARLSGLPPEDLGVLGSLDFVEALSRGFAAHHAGMLPTFREIVEELFVTGRLRAVFATETLALGINMPARTVVLEKLVKFNGQNLAELTAGEYTQLTGRAGRRGIDVEGHAVVLWNPHLDPAVVAGLAATRTYPLSSSFRPTSNMAVNLVATMGRAAAARVLETSFAQFQADRGVAGLHATIRRNEEAMAGYAESMECHLGDFAEYARLRTRLTDVEKGAVRARSRNHRAAVETSLERLRPGDVVWMSVGHDEGAHVILGSMSSGRGAGRAAPSLPVLTPQARVRRIGADDVTEPVDVAATLPARRQLDARSPRNRRDLAAAARARVPHRPPSPAAARDDESAPEPAGAAETQELRRRLRAHPCHGCADREQHARWAERWWRLHRETERLRGRLAGRTHSISRQFEGICDMLTDLGYLDEGGTRVTPAGERLRRLYTERDLLAAECLRHGIWDGLDAPGLAAAVSCLIHEPRRENEHGEPRLPNRAVTTAIVRMAQQWEDLAGREHAHGLPSPAAPDAGIAWAVHRWAAGHGLNVVLRESDLAAGDFVRRCKQLVDLLGQIQQASDDSKLRGVARSAVDGVLRGVVAADRLD